MPIHVAKGALIAISVIAATAFAVYESPEVRQFIENLRRQAAHGLHTLGNNLEPRDRREEETGQPLFNRPEDAEGVLERGRVDADEASRRRQREELAYWNALKEQRKERERAKTESEGDGTRKRTRSSSFGDFLQKDETAGQGTYVLSSAVDTARTENLVHRRASRGMDRGAMFANPFGDENGIEFGERDAEVVWGAQQDQSQVLMTPGKDEVLSVASEMESEDLYGAEDNRIRRPIVIAELPAQSAEEQLIDTSELTEVDPTPSVQAAIQDEEAQYATPARYPHDDASDHDAYAAIHAWADRASTNSSAAGFYSPLPTTPRVLSEASDGDFGSVSDAAEEGSEDGEGVATPRTVDSVSVVGVDEGFESASEEGEGRSTPGSWTEVGSMVSSEAERIA